MTRKISWTVIAVNTFVALTTDEKAELALSLLVVAALCFFDGRDSVKASR